MDFFGAQKGSHVHKQLAILYVRRDDFAVHKQLAILYVRRDDFLAELGRASALPEDPALAGPGDLTGRPLENRPSTSGAGRVGQPAPLGTAPALASPGL